MAAPADKQLGPYGRGRDDSILAELQRQQSRIIDALRTLTAKLDADAGVTDTNYNALTMDAANANAPQKIV